MSSDPRTEAAAFFNVLFSQAQAPEFTQATRATWARAHAGTQHLGLNMSQE